MTPLLVILNPRHIPECVEAFEALDIDRAWVTGFREPELAAPLQELAHSGYDPLVVCSDDVVVSQKALDAVLELYATGVAPVVTGFCNLDETDDRVNLCKNRLVPGPPGKDHYDFLTRREVEGSKVGVVASTFAGMCLTTMSAAMWAALPIECYGHPGYGCDYSLSYRLQLNGQAIVAPRDGFVWHLKETWSELDSTPGRELLIGSVEPGVRMDVREPAKYEFDLTGRRGVLASP